MDTRQEIASDRWIRMARYSLIFSGVCYLGLIGGSPFLGAAKFNSPAMSADFNRGFVIGFVVIMAVVCGGIAVLNFVTAWGLANGRRWAWILGIVLGGLYAPSMCMPFGVLILYALLREKVRPLYLANT